MKSLGQSDCVLFDIDGVLVDVRKSYNEAIKKTVNFMVKHVTGKRLDGIVTDRIILKFRETGGFNNDADTTYAITLATLVCLKTSSRVSRIRNFIIQVADNADSSGYISVEKYLDSLESEKFKDFLAYPGPIKDSIIARVFDELFYGKDLFGKQHSLDLKYCHPKVPLIKNDRLVATKNTMKKLNKMFNGNLAIVSGRSRVAAEYSLKPVFGYFDLDACVFLEDENREYAKPNPYAIKKAMNAMGTHNAVYAGDSAEDLMMARSAERELQTKIAFVGIYGCSPRPRMTIKQFQENKADVIKKSINDLPRLVD